MDKWYIIKLIKIKLVLNVNKKRVKISDKT